MSGKASYRQWMFNAVYNAKNDTSLYKTFKIELQIIFSQVYGMLKLTVTYNSANNLTNTSNYDSNYTASTSFRRSKHSTVNTSDVNGN
jgi:hypothetical protein